jgi:hypothetical protein
MKMPAGFTNPGIRRPVLAVISANNISVSQTINVDVQSPVLNWQQAILAVDGKTLKITLINSGNAALRNFSLDIYEAEPGSAATVSEEPLSTQTVYIQELAPAAVIEPAFELPDGIDLKSKRFLLRGSTRLLPLLEWELPSPEITWADR